MGINGLSFGAKHWFTGLDEVIWDQAWGKNSYGRLVCSKPECLNVVIDNPPTPPPRKLQKKFFGSKQNSTHLDHFKGLRADSKICHVINDSLKEQLQKRYNYIKWQIQIEEFVSVKYKDWDMRQDRPTAVHLGIEGQVSLLFSQILYTYS